jgi:hypothetical protein
LHQHAHALSLGVRVGVPDRVGPARAEPSRGRPLAGTPGRPAARCTTVNWWPTRMQDRAGLDWPDFLHLLGRKGKGAGRAGAKSLAARPVSVGAGQAARRGQHVGRVGVKTVGGIRYGGACRRRLARNGHSDGRPFVVVLFLLFMMMSRLSIAPHAGRARSAHLGALGTCSLFVLTVARRRMGWWCSQVTARRADESASRNGAPLLASPEQRPIMVAAAGPAGRRRHSERVKRQDSHATLLLLLWRQRDFAAVCQGRALPAPFSPRRRRGVRLQPPPTITIASAAASATRQQEAGGRDCLRFISHAAAADSFESAARAGELVRRRRRRHPLISGKSN